MDRGLLSYVNEILVHKRGNDQGDKVKRLLGLMDGHLIQWLECFPDF